MLIPEFRNIIDRIILYVRNFGFSYPGVSSDVKAHLWKSVCQSTLGYGCESINMNKSNITNLETCQGNIIKQNLGI